MQLLKHALTRSNAANLAAFFIIIVGACYAFYHRDAELIRSLAMFASGYLFGKASTKRR